MEELWASTKALPGREVHAALTQDRALAYTTVMTVLDRLVGKGLVDRNRVGRAWDYRAVHSRAELVADEIARLLGACGTEQNLVLGELVDRLDGPQLRHLARLLAAKGVPED